MFLKFYSTASVEDPGRRVFDDMDLAELVEMGKNGIIDARAYMNKMTEEDE